MQVFNTFHCSLLVYINSSLLVYIRISQSGPVKAGVHVHSNFPGRSSHVPLLRHGSEAHSLISI